MQKQSTLVLFVPDLAEGITFYVELLGFTLDEQHPSADIAQITDIDGFTILLAGPSAGNVTPYLTESHFTVQPGEIMTYSIADFDTLYAKLHRQDERVAVVEKRWGDRYLDVCAPSAFCSTGASVSNSSRTTYFLCVWCLGVLYGGSRWQQDNSTRTDFTVDETCTGAY